MTSKKDAAPKEPQTASLVWLHRELQSHPSRGLTPAKLAHILDEAENGDIRAQAELFEDMEEKDGHIAAELGKRRRALLLPWQVLPPDNPTPFEQGITDKLRELMDAVPAFDDVLYDMTDAIGKGFACLEIEWHKQDGWWLPASLTHRPQSWFMLHRGERQELRLRSNTTQPDGSVGEPLLPFGWLVHTHRAKSGWLERTALFRQLVWPYLFKNYSVGDLADFLEIYGIPMRLGRYPASASEKEKSTLMRALVGIGHNAAGIIPEGMNMEFIDAVHGDPAAFQLMMDWCERTQSKVILGGTLTSGADGKTSTNALGNVHNEVRHDLRDSDIRQLNATLTTGLLHAIATVNGLMPPEGARRAPVLRLKVEDTEDITTFAQALPALVNIGFQIPVQWAQERLGIPQPDAGEDVLHPAAPMGFGMATANTVGAGLVPAQTGWPQGLPLQPSGAYLGQTIPRAPVPPFKQDADTLGEAGDAIISDWLEQLRAIVQEAPSMEALQDSILSAFGDMDSDRLAHLMALAFELAELRGMAAVRAEDGT